MTKIIRRLILGFLLSLAGLAVQAQEELEGMSVDVQSLERELQVMTEGLERIREDDGELVALGERARLLAERAVGFGVEISPRLTDVRVRLEQIGPPDEAGDEPPALAEERRELAAERALINTLLGQLETVSIKANALQNTVADARRELFTSRLSRRYDLNAAFGPELLTDLRDRTGDLVRSVGSWLRFAWRFKSPQMGAATVLSLAVALMFVIAGRRMLGPLVSRDPAVAKPAYVARLLTAFMATLFPTVALWLFFVLVYLLYSHFDVLRGDIGLILQALFVAIGIVFFVWRLAEVVFAPRLPQWRLAPVGNRAASLLKWLAVSMAIVTVTDEIVTDLTNVAGSSLPITVANSLVSSTLTAVILAMIAFVRPFPGSDGEPDRKWPAAIRLPLLGLAALLILSAVAGYVGFAGFLAEQLVVTGAVAATMYLGYLAAHAISREKALAHTRFGKWLRVSLELSESRVDQIGLAIGMLLTLAIISVGLPILLILWGFKWTDIRIWLLGAVTEFSVGSISISLTGVLAGVVVFLVGFWFTKLLQRWIDADVLSRSHVDPGVRNSIKTAFGYVGITIAALIGVSAAGINLSQLALIAGALSLGIGFGLQNIVSNFVSGLILLAERPFKVGDWIEAGGVSGNVKSINVRATEIETFQRKTVILPNSELINNAVSNWTHRNTLGRIEIPVGVSYKSDPNQVRDILLEIAHDHPRILRNPEPFVLFDNFGDSSLEFELRAFLADINYMLTVSTEVRFAIFERFKAVGIEIPFPQRDVNLRVVDENEADAASLDRTAVFGPIKASRQKQRED